MGNIDKIEIRISGSDNHMELVIIPSMMMVFVKRNVKTIDSESLNKLLDIIRKWDYEYVDDTVEDAETFKVRIYNGSGVDEYFGSGKYPKNYSSFIELLKDICE